MKILLVEDNKDHQFLIKDAFADAYSGVAEVQIEERLGAGLVRLDSDHFDIFLCDLQLPDSGLENTIETLQNLHTKTPIVVLTSLNDNDIAQQLVQSGVQDYLPKDELSGSLLLRICNNAIERKCQQVKLEQQNADHKLFCYSLSHDFKSPIRVIGKLVGIMRTEVEKRVEFTEDELRWFEMIDAKCVGICSLVDNLYGYLSIGNEQHTIEPVDLHELLLELVDGLIGEFDSSPSIVIDKLPIVDGNPAHLNLVFRNLITNAIKYNKRNPEIKISVSNDPDAGTTAIIVADNGIGIDEKDFENIFAPFKRSCESAKFQGTGLGLSIVKRIVESCEGKISVTSQLGVGSEFCVTLRLSTTH